MGLEKIWQRSGLSKPPVSRASEPTPSYAVRRFIRLLERELREQSFHGIISLHSDDTSERLYGFVAGATLTEHLLRPALQAASSVLQEQALLIALDAILREYRKLPGYAPNLGAPPECRHRRRSDRAQAGPDITQRA